MIKPYETILRFHKDALERRSLSDPYMVSKILEQSKDIGNGYIEIDQYKLWDIHYKRLQEKNPELLPQYISSYFEYILNQKSDATDETIQQRIKICKNCEFWNQQEYNNIGCCEKYRNSTWSRIKAAEQKCPIDKWPN